MKRLAVAFTGASNSGKTTLIIKLSKILKKRGFKVAIIKHDPHDKANPDKEGKDSWKFYQNGAEVALLSPTRTTIFKHTSKTIEEIADCFDSFDYLLVEGLKTLPLPRICVVRNTINTTYFEISDTLAVDFNTIKKKDLPTNVNTIDLSNLDEIINWINKNGKNI